MNASPQFRVELGLTQYFSRHGFRVYLAPAEVVRHAFVMPKTTMNDGKAVLAAISNSTSAICGKIDLKPDHPADKHIRHHKQCHLPRVFSQARRTVFEGSAILLVF